jgi:hypothetical protein
MTDLGAPYRFSGARFDTSLTLSQAPGGQLFGGALVLDKDHNESYVVPLEGKLSASGSGPAKFSLKGSIDEPKTNVRISGEGDASVFRATSKISVQGAGSETVRWDLVPQITEYGITIKVVPQVNDGGTVTGSGTMVLPGTNNEVAVETRQTVDGERFSFTARSVDGKEKVEIQGLGQLPGVSRLFRATANPGYGLLILAKPSLVLHTDE